MKKVEKNENQIVFTAHVDETLANSIRRYVNQVPVVAVDEVEISRNDSALYDETIAHRIGLVPLKDDKKGGEKFKLEEKKEGVIYSGDLKGKGEVVYKKIPLTTLGKGQEIQLTATTKAGKGSEHSKFSPGLIYYRNVSEIALPKDFHDEVKEIFPDAGIKEKGDKIVVLDDRKKEVADVFEGLMEKKGRKAHVEPKEELVITVESFGQMTPESVFKKSIEILKKDLGAIGKEIGKAQ